MQPTTADIIEPHRIPSFASDNSVVPLPNAAYDRSAMNMETVSPIPQSMHTDANDFQFAP